MNKREEEKLKKQQEKLQKELERTEAMSVYEKEYSDCTYICGIDEVGRGPFAGPVVAGAVILPKDDPILYLNDSKKLSEKKTGGTLRRDHGACSGDRNRDRKSGKD